MVSFGVVESSAEATRRRNSHCRLRQLLRSCGEVLFDEAQHRFEQGFAWIRILGDEERADLLVRARDRHRFEQGFAWG